MDDASQMPAMAEPFFVGSGAAIRIHPVTTQEDLGKAAPESEHAAQRYGQGAARVGPPLDRSSRRRSGPPLPPVYRAA